MAWTTLVNSTTADAVEVNNNFYWISQGTRLPMSGTSLNPVDGTYDIGSSTYKWANAFFDDLTVNDDLVVGGEISTTNKTIWQLESRVELSATSQRIEFSGLNGDDSIEYQIWIRAIHGYAQDSATANIGIFITFNGDSAANYGSHYISALGGAPGADRNTGQTYIEIGSTTWAATASAEIISTFSKIDFFSKAGNIRLLNTYTLFGATNDSIYGQEIEHYVWDNTSDTITSIQFNSDGTFISGTTIEIWKRG